MNIFRTVDDVKTGALICYIQDLYKVSEKYEIPTVDYLMENYANGIYDHEKAYDVWKQVVDECAKMDCKELGEPDSYYPTAVRKKCAIILEKYYYDQFITHNRNGKIFWYEYFS